MKVTALGKFAPLGHSARLARDYAEREGGLLRAACETGCGLVLRGFLVRTRPCEP